MARGEKIVITERMTAEHLRALVSERGDETFPVVGWGMRAKRLILQLADERPDMDMRRTEDGGYWAIVNPTRSVAWYSPGD